jgi:serine kinase of HPr protein (carbohydrate metabolism regulator)
MRLSRRGKAKMNLRELVDRLALEFCAAEEKLDAEVTGGYASDLLSYVMARAKEGNVWVTMQGHPNVVAVASLVNLAGVIITEGTKPELATLDKATQEGIPILATRLTTYEVVGRLYELGVGHEGPTE